MRLTMSAAVLHPDLDFVFEKDGCDQAIDHHTRVGDIAASILCGFIALLLVFVAALTRARQLLVSSRFRRLFPLFIFFVFFVFFVSPVCCAEECASGFYGSQDRCQPCSPGFFNNNTGASECVPCPGGTAAGAQSDPGLRFFSFEEGSGKTTAAGAVLHNFADPPTSESGWSEEGLVFDGVDDYVELEPWEFGGTASYEFWFRLSQNPAKASTIMYHMLGFGDGSGANSISVAFGNGRRSTDEAIVQGVRFAVSSAAIIKCAKCTNVPCHQCQKGCGGSSCHAFSGTNPTKNACHMGQQEFNGYPSHCYQEDFFESPVHLQNNVWIHLVVTFSTEGRRSVFVNGARSPTSLVAVDLPRKVIRMALLVGKEQTGKYIIASKKFQGTIRYLGVYNRALTLADQQSATTAHRIGLAGATTLAACQACDAGFDAPAGSVGGAACQPVSPGNYNDGSGTKACPAGTAAGAQSDPELRFFSFEGGSGKTTAAGAVLHNFADPPTAESGWGEEGLVFDGVDDYVELPTWEVGGATSIEMFLLLAHNGKYSSILQFHSGLNSEYISLGAGDGQNIRLSWNVIVGTGWNNVKRVVISWEAHTWIHVVATVDANGGTKLYKDGVLENSLSRGSVPSKLKREKHWLGRNSFEDADFFSGTIRYLAVYDHALTLADQLSATTVYGIGLAGATTLAACQACAAGFDASAGSVGGAACQPVSPGNYNDGSGTKACPGGTAAGAQSDPGLRFFSFEGGSGNITAVGAVLHNFADPATAASGWGEGGLAFDGVDDYVELPTWEMGGAMSFEVIVKHASFLNEHARVVEFYEDGEYSFALKNDGTSSDAWWFIRTSSSIRYLHVPNFWSQHAWVHAVATIAESGTMKLYKDGKLMGTLSNGYVPNILTRSMHRVGGGLHGAIRYLAIYDRALTLADQLSTTTAYRIGLAGATKLAACQPAVCPAGRYLAHPNLNVGVCATIDPGYYSNASGALKSTGDGACSPGYFCATGATDPTGGNSTCTPGRHCPMGSSNTSGVGACGNGFFCAPGQPRAERSAGNCTFDSYRDNAKQDSIQRDFQAPCGRISFSPAPLFITAVKPLQSEATFTMTNVGALPVTWRLDTGSVPRWMRIKQIDAGGGVRYLKSGAKSSLLGAGDQEELILEVHSANTVTTNATLRILQTQLWPNPGEPTAANDLPMALPVIFEVQHGTVMLLPRINDFRLEVNKTMSGMAVSVYNLQLTNLSWSARIEGKRADSWLSISPTRGTLDGIQEGGETTSRITLAMSASPSEGPGTKRATLVLTDRATNTEQNVPITLDVAPGPAEVLQSLAVWPTKVALRMPTVLFSIATKDVFGFATTKALESLGDFELSWALVSGACLANSPCDGSVFVGLGSADGKLGFTADIALQANGTYAFNLTNSGVHVHNSPFWLEILPQVCPRPNELPLPGTGNGCVCEEGYERKPNMACGQCKSGSVWQGFGSACKKCDAGTFERDGVCVDCDKGSVSASGSSACTRCEPGLIEQNNACVECSAGKYENGGRSACIDCNTGSISEAGSFICTECKSGLIEQNNICQECAAGKYEGGSRSACIPCNTGFFSDAGSSACTRCEPGLISRNNVCEKCAAGKYENGNRTGCIGCERGIQKNPPGSSGRGTR